MYYHSRFLLNECYLTVITQHNYAATVLAMFSRYGNVDIAAIVSGDGVHDPTNLMTLSVQVHRFFDELEVWLEATGKVRIFILPSYHRSCLARTTVITCARTSR